MDPPEPEQSQAQAQAQAQAPSHSRRGGGGGGARVLTTLIATIIYVILSLSYFKKWGLDRNYVPLPREFDNPVLAGAGGTTDTNSELERNLRVLQELTIGKQSKGDDDGDVDDNDGNNSCPTPLKLYKNHIVFPNSGLTNTVTTKIPQILHLSERSRCLNRDMYDAIQMWQESFPSFSIFFHDDAAVDRLLYSKEPEYSDWRSEFPDIVKILPCVAPGAMKIDIWRVLVLWKYGGVYSDVDIVPNPDKLTERVIHPDSEWFSLSDAWGRPSQWLFATSAHHMSMKNTLHIIAQRVLDVGNVQKTKLVFITGPQALYWGWKDSLYNETETELTEKKKINHTAELDSMSAPPPTADLDQITGTIITFEDGSRGQWIEAQKGWIHPYWKEMVPFEETECISRKQRSQKHFGRVHWVTAQKSGQNGLPQISCRKHLENLQQKVMEQGQGGQQENAAVSAEDAPSLSNEVVLHGNKSIADLIFKNSNNSTTYVRLSKLRFKVELV